MKAGYIRFLAALGMTTLTAAACQAQPVRRSQHGTVSQMIGATRVGVDYNRPVARGRTLFGDEAVVRYGRVWNPGADTATTVAFSGDVTVNGQPLAAGTYSLWMIPRADEWTVIFSRAQPVFHVPYPGEDRDALRVTAKPGTASHMEVLAFYFPVVEPDSAVLRLHWGTTTLEMSIRVGNREQGIGNRE